MRENSTQKQSKNRGRTKAKKKKNPKKETIYREERGKNQPRKTELKKEERKQSTNPNTERKREQEGSTQGGELSLKLSSYLQTKKKTPDSVKEHSQQTGVFFVVLKKLLRNQEGKHIQVITERRLEEAVDENHQSSSTLQASLVSRSRYDFIPFASSFQKIVQEHCEGNLITFTSVRARVNKSRVPLIFAQRGHWVGPVTGRGYAQPCGLN